ncbi:MAG: hypothetical protein M1433_00645 [Candidatus Parvarchaeota archaeon]|nr:hypothetical protein [Candidatus Parvarchaeota archaeon]
MDHKGQVFTIDLLIALFIFILVFTSIIVFLYEVASVSNPYSSYYVQFVSDTLNNIASSGINTLTGSQGYPTNWNSMPCSSIKTLGIMLNSYEVSVQKLYNLTTLSSSSLDCLSQLLRAGNSFNISVFYLNGSTVKVNSVPITAGFPIPADTVYTASIQRYEVLSPGSTIIRISYSEWIS